MEAPSAFWCYGGAMHTPDTDAESKLHAPDAATPAPAPAVVDTQTPDAPPQQSERTSRHHGGFADDNGESVPLGGTVGTR